MTATISVGSDPCPHTAKSSTHAGGVLRRFRTPLDLLLSWLFVAGNGIEALEKLRSGEIPNQRRLVLLDLDMARMNGIEFLRERRRDPELCTTPVVVHRCQLD